MSQKNETVPLLIALIVTAGIIGGASWFILKNLGLNTRKTTQNPQVQSPNPGNDNSVQAFAQVTNVPDGLFNYGGSTTWAPIRRDVDSAIATVYPNFRLRYSDPPTGAPGSGSGIKMLLNDQLAFSQSSRSLKDEEFQTATQRGFTLKQIPVAIDGIAIASHRDLNVSGLTVAQLKEIYTGKITNWRQIGGPNLPITAYSRRVEEGGTIEFFRENVLEKESFGQNVTFVPTTTQALRKVAETPGSLYYASAPEVVPQCTVKSLPLGRKAGEWIAPYQQPFVPLSECPNRRNQLNDSAFQSGEYPITRNLFVIVKENGQTDEQAGKAYANLLLSAQGQELISKAGFVRIR